MNSLMRSKVYRVNDWAFVAAYSQVEAIDWHARSFPGCEMEPGDTHEVSDRLLMQIEEGRNQPKIQMRDCITMMLRQGEPLPFMVCIDGYYA